jgi:ribonuclease P protein component
LNTPTRYFFKKEAKLKSRKIIQKLFAEGKSFTIYPLKVIWIPYNTEQHVQAGISVSSRYFKKAVDRNKIKRLIRESYRLQKNRLEDHMASKQLNLSVFFIYIGKEIPLYQTLFDACSLSINQLIKIADEQSK